MPWDFYMYYEVLTYFPSDMSFVFETFECNLFPFSIFLLDNFPFSIDIIYAVSFFRSFLNEEIELGKGPFKFNVGKFVEFGVHEF